jgi:hypothetical protein
MYQGNPTPAGSAVFAPPTYGDRPRQFTVTYGLDLAYAGKKGSDWSVLVRLLTDENGLSYIDLVMADQVPEGQFVPRVNAITAAMPGPVCWALGGQEPYLAPKLGINGLATTRAINDKYTRAKDLITRWEEGKVLIPHDPDAQVLKLLSSFARFTGEKTDKEDDWVDATASAINAISKGKPVDVSAANRAIRERQLQRREERQRGRTLF